MKRFLVLLVMLVLMPVHYAQNSSIYPFTNKKGRIGFVDNSGKIVVKPQYDNYDIDEDDGLIIVEIDGRPKVIDFAGKTIVQPIYANIRSYREGLAAVETDGKWGFVDKTGKLVIKPQYDKVGFFSEGMVTIRVDNKWVY